VPRSHEDEASPAKLENVQEVPEDQMKTSQVTEAILSRMSKAERAKMPGVQTAEEAQAKFAARSERELQNQIAQYLRLKGIWFFQARMDKPTSGQVGTPDFLMNGYALEVKFEKGKLSDEQIECHDRMRKSGWLVSTVNTFEDARNAIEAFEIMRPFNQPTQ